MRIKPIPWWTGCALVEVTPFKDLPGALVEDMLSECSILGSTLSDSFKKIHDNKASIHEKLVKKGLIKKASEVFIASYNPTSCGIDGSYVNDPLLSTDMLAIAAVAIEGLTPPSEIRHWPIPHHLCKVMTTPHYESTLLVSRAIMVCMEIELAVEAPHDVVMLDGSLTTPFIYLNQALNRLKYVDPKLSSLLTEMLENTFESFREILYSKRSDKIYVGVPKYTTKKEISKNILGLNNYEDRGLLSFILEVGEFVGPIKMAPPETPWHLVRNYPNKQENIVIDIKEGLDELQILYYKPYLHLPAIRLEISKSIANNNQRLSVLFESLRIQCGAPGIMEPYPLYIADRMVKNLGKALPAIRRAATQDIALNWENELGNIYLAMHGYRT